MPEILVKKDNVIFDATVASTLMSCGRLTDLRFNHHLVPLGGKSNSLEVGSLVHVALETYYKARIDGKSHVDGIELGLKAGENYVGEMKNTPAESERYTIGSNYALKTCEEYFEFYKNDHWTPLEAEVVKKKLLYEDENLRVLWKGKLDLIADTNQGIYPIDHKTMKQRRDTISLNNQFMGQCVLMDTRMMIVNKIGFQSSLKPAEKFTRTILSYSLDRLREWSEEVIPYYAALMVGYSKSGSWPPNFTHCESKYGFCPMKDVCESDSGMREEVIRLNFIKGEPWDIQNED